MGGGSSFSERLNCMKTRFQSSIQPLPSGVGSWPNVEGVGSPSPVKKWSSVHGPQGPVSPACQKLSPGLPGIPIMRSSAEPVTFFQIARASSSAGIPLAPPKTVITRRSAGICHSLVSSSQAKGMASSLK